MIRAIVAMDDCRGIAIGQKIPWDAPDDRRHFRALTINSTVLMGYRTYETLLKPLTRRRNVVWCRQGSILKDGFEQIHDLAAFLHHQEIDVWVMGGGGLYQEALPYCEELHITQLAGDYHCSVFFPKFEDQFEQVGRKVEAPNRTYTIWRRKATSAVNETESHRIT
ncbi:hypothetical protein E6P97_03040 [Patescibacteria group bacterium]|nr:MAG: hypothetical protein E6P97_03040 [Patescibacteria group bacterium]